MTYRRTDFYSYEGMPDVVVSVGLVRPKRGIFGEEIEYLIAIASNSELRLLGVNVQASGDLAMYLTHISVGSDGILFLSICGLSNGQLYLAGHDGNLYELEYEAEESWFKRKCSLVNLTRSKLSLFIPTFLQLGQSDPLLSVVADERRMLLYTLSDSSLLSVYSMQSEGDLKYNLKPLASKRLLESARKFVGQGSFDEESFKPFSIHVIPSTVNSNAFKSGANSGNVSLMAVTNRGNPTLT